MKCFAGALTLVGIFLPFIAAEYSDTYDIVEDANGCTTLIHKFNPLIHKSSYNVGIYSSEGAAEVFRMYNQTFSQYLTATAGRRFDPPIQFEIVPVTLTSLMDKAEDEEVDFYFSSSAVQSCMATEYDSQALVTIVNRREARGHTYELDKYGGVMFTLASNEQINTIEDLKDKTIGAGDITAMGAGQTQFHAMFQAGLSFVADPKQVVFTMDERKIVDGVLNGDFEVGFARTDQIERTTDENGEHIDPDLFKVLNPQIHVLDDGNLFPFMSSTTLHPEWPTSALDHVNRDVAKEVQAALLALRDHATAFGRNKTLRCDTTPELAELAFSATQSGQLVGFRNARNYFGVRTKQEAAGFLQLHEDGALHCIRGDTLYDDLYCPEGQYKLTKEEFDKSCEKAGLKCKEGYRCYCKPCVEAFDVSVFQSMRDRTGAHLNNTSTETETGTGCEKMSLCGVIEQTKTLHFMIVDNRKRENPHVEVDIHVDTRTITMDVEPHPTRPYTYEFTWGSNDLGIGIMNIRFDDMQIPQSPVRIQIVERQCDLDYPGESRSSTSTGTCECSEGTMEIGGKCVDGTIMAIVISVAAFLLISSVGTCYVKYRNHKADEIWQVQIEELQFDDPVEVIGQGSFGVVLLAQYRGTKVALKRAIKLGAKGSRHTTRGKGSSRGESKGSNKRNRSNMTDSVGLSSSGRSSNDSGEHDCESDPEVGQEDSCDEKSYVSSVHTGSRGGSNGSARGVGSKSRSSGNQNSLGFLAEDFGSRSNWAWLFPWMRQDNYHHRFKEAILGGNSASLSKTWHAVLCPWFNAQVRAEEDFILEMRTLSRLRHPCITTVLGAVTSRSHDPMLVMEYMEYGSLYSLLQNETMHLSGEIILQISRDISQGLRFLHSSKPEILHGDMKARNVLIDSRFRDESNKAWNWCAPLSFLATSSAHLSCCPRTTAKLCDFGLSTKKDSRITGTPFWLAPEYLRGQTKYTSMCDIYSIGIIIYEIYAREDPYKGEDFRETLRKVCDRRTNKRPPVPPTCPPKFADTMKKCWSPDPLFRPSAKDLDTLFLDMTMRDAEPLTGEEQMQNARKERKGDMLYELFPKKVADQLKAGQKVEPEQHEEVTVVFSDIVHFTDISRQLPPLKVSNMLDRLYLSFDKVSAKNKVFKVETIGDAYMGVTNLEKDQEDTHVKNAALFAIDLVTEASKVLIDEEKPSLGYINIRVGFHSGPVVSNVIGSLNPRYGLFGDTVNTSSRMESNSKANRILCSEAAFKLLNKQAPEISTKKRGKIAVKGKGDMVVWWVGDEEVKNHLENLATSPITKEETSKRVGFVEGSQHEEGETENGEVEEICVSDYDDDDEPQERHSEAVDDHLWRRELKGKMTEEEEGKTPPPKKQEQVKKFHEEQPVVKKSTSAKRSIKEAVHISRRKYA